jgi:hypothetical protein
MKTKTHTPARNIQNPVWVLAWVEMDGIKQTGKMVRRDLNWFPETVAAMRGHACVWSRRFSDVARGQEHAKAEGKTFLCLEDTDDVLNIARLIVETTASK